MSASDLLSELEACTLPEDQFHHVAHVRAAWLYLKRFPPAEAILRFSQMLRTYTSSLGKADRYHETITWAYLLLLNERVHRSGCEQGWEQFSTENLDLLDWKNSILWKYYREDTLRSDLARRIFVMPDRL